MEQKNRARRAGRLQQLLGDGYQVLEEGQNGRTIASEDPCEGEKNGIRSLPADLHEAIEEMARDHIKLEFFGDLTSLDSELYQLCQETRKISEGYTGFQVNVCLNYGGRDEIVRAARKFAQDCLEGKAKPEELTETAFANDLYSAGIPDPELIIRPSGEIRTSNFLLWQSAYSEYYFTDVLWPDFSPDELLKAIASYQGRSRRCGGV